MRVSARLNRVLTYSNSTIRLNATSFCLRGSSKLGPQKLFPFQNVMKLAHPVAILFGAGATRGGLRTNILPPPLDADFFEIAGQMKGHGTPSLARKVLEMCELFTARFSTLAWRITIETLKLALKSAHSPRQLTNPEIGRSDKRISKN